MARCFGDGNRLYEAYHDDEWARPVVGEPAHFERLALESFQSGLSWLTVLRKRENFRAAFGGFEPSVVAEFGDDDVARLLVDAGIVRNRAKIEATISNARAVRAMNDDGDSLAALFARHAPPSSAEPALSWTDVPRQTPESVALAAELVRLGFRFVGPTTAYASMQAIGIVNDHLATCPARELGAGGGEATSSGE